MEKEQTNVKVTWLINYWVVDKDTHVKASPTHLKSVIVSLNVGDASSKTDVASQWLPTTTKLTIMDTNQHDPLMKLPISIEHDSLQYHTNVSINSTTTLHFASEHF